MVDHYDCTEAWHNMAELCDAIFLFPFIPNFYIQVNSPV